MQASFRTKKSAAVYHWRFALCPSLSPPQNKKVESDCEPQLRHTFDSRRFGRASGIKKKPAWNEGVRGKRGWQWVSEPDCVNTCACAYIFPGNWKSINAELGRKVKSPMNVSRSFHVGCTRPFVKMPQSEAIDSRVSMRQNIRAREYHSPFCRARSWGVPKKLPL